MPKLRAGSRLVGCLLVFSCSCGRSASHAPGDGLVLAGTNAAGFAFTLVSRDYQSSSLWYDDLATGVRREELTGESGDPALFWLGDALAFFNRKATSLNARVYDPRREAAQTVTQLATNSDDKGALEGDPHAVLPLDSERLLLAHYVAGALVIVDRATFATLATVSADFDVGEGDAQLRPEDLLLRSTPNGREIYVLHQGRDKGYALNGSQQIFVLKDTGVTLTPIDLDTTKPKVQGIKLTVSNPGSFAARDALEPLVSADCSIWDSAACESGIERINLVERTATRIKNLSGQSYAGNGGLLEGNGATFYWSVAKLTADGKPSDLAIVKIDAQQAGDPLVVHQFPSGSAGCCSLEFDPSSETLIVGDRTADGLGFFTVYRKNGTSERLDLPGVPYAAAFIPR